MNLQIVAFTGLAGAGKSTAAKALVEHLVFTRVSFADPLRQMLLGLGITSAQMSEGKHLPIGWLDGKTPRQLLQTLGTEWGRQLVHPEIWTRAAARRIDDLRATGIAGVVFDDCRFDNEAQMVRAIGGTVIRIERDGLTAMNHASEAGISDALIDLTIENQWDEQVFSRVVVRMIEHLTRKAA